jgi:hypothetical protein
MAPANQRMGVCGSVDAAAEGRGSRDSAAASSFDPARTRCRTSGCGSLASSTRVSDHDTAPLVPTAVQRRHLPG